MKKNLFAILMLTAVFFAASCTKDEPDAPTLTLSEIGTITVAKAASEKAVTVTTNQPEWTAMANVGWIELVQSGTTLTLKTTENTESVLRKGEVMVMAGGLGRKLLVEQSASDVTIVTIPDKLGINQWGGNFQFDVNANTKDWTVTSDADWVKVTPKQFKSEVAIEVSENTERQPRVAKLTLMGADKKGPKEFIITQSGIMYYSLPLLEPGASYSEVKQFELSRRSSERIDLNYVLGSPGAFDTKSPAFPVAAYAFTKGKLSSASITASDKKVLEDPEFEKMMIDAGFAKKNATDYSKKVTVDKQEFVLQATVIIGSPSGVLFVFIPKQPKPMPTFANYPYGFTGFGKGKAEIDTFEKANGGTYNKKESSYQDRDKYWFHYYDVKKGDLLARAYFVEDDAAKKLQQTSQYITKRDLVFFEVNGELFVTNEFKKLTESEGFTYKGNNRGWHTFVNNTKKLQMRCRWVQYSDMDAPVIDLKHEPLAGSSTVEEKGLPDFNKIYAPSKTIKASEAFLRNN